MGFQDGESALAIKGHLRVDKGVERCVMIMKLRIPLFLACSRVTKALRSFSNIEERDL